MEKSKDITIQMADQNADGKINLEDVSIVAENFGNVMQKGTQALKETTEGKLRQIELKNLQPIFLETLSDIDFTMS